MSLIEIKANREGIFTRIMSFDDSVIASLPLTLDVTTMIVLYSIGKRIRRMCLRTKVINIVAALRNVLEIYRDKAARVVQ